MGGLYSGCQCLRAASCLRVIKGAWARVLAHWSRMREGMKPNQGKSSLVKGAFEQPSNQATKTDGNSWPRRGTKGTWPDRGTARDANGFKDLAHWFRMREGMKPNQGKSRLVKVGGRRISNFKIEGLRSEGGLAGHL